ncbi:class C sortase [Bifidobacterium pullorum subsp. saeculare]|uniref:class C sortase n=1 Tax=Bifidobacterium pullorum TaxID=78448 RepID=UPI00195612D7|nr:class C sortase [Bifidobacterium pullorum]MBM6730576.1 class C sortase [Bifidobacterium pullorum subsp. saeculare]
MRVSRRKNNATAAQECELSSITDVADIDDDEKTTVRNRRAATRQTNGRQTAQSDDYVPQSFNEAIDVTDIVRRQRSLRRSMWILRILSLLLLILAVCVISYPLALQYQSDVRLAHTTSAAAERVAGWPYPQAEESLAAARAYNERLAASGQPVLGEAKDLFSDQSGSSHASDEDSVSAQDEEYQSLLDSGNGVMGAIRIPKISVDLPIYHGTSESALASGSGHLYGSSLPVGGESTHAVLTGHRGLVEAMMFTRLDEMKVGDYFYIDVMGETLGYKVDRITVIEPDDTSQLKIVPGEDRVTLMTCTPYGVNTHRLLVSGVRAAIPGDIPDIDDAPKDPRTAAVVTVVGVLVPLLLVTAFLRRGAWQPMRHGSRWPKHW